MMALGRPQMDRRALADALFWRLHALPALPATSAQMIDACFASRTHYVDITGEFDVFVAAQRRQADAQAAGIRRISPSATARADHLERRGRHPGIACSN
jgi:hypothetical protein